MDRIAWAMRHGLPNQKYLDFVVQYLLKLEKGKRRVDPFALDLPPKERWEVYVERRDVEKELNRWDSQVILGPPGSGKTTLFRTSPPASSSGSVLVVRLPLAEIGISVPEPDLLEGKTGLLAPTSLAGYIFNAYWEDLIWDDHKRGRHLSTLLREQQWIERLRWFYQHRSPSRPYLRNETELMERLSISTPHVILDPQLPPRDVLRELCAFITSYPVYTHVQIRIDGVESLSAPAAARLLRDIQSLYDLCLENVSFKLFADSALQAQVEAMPCVRDGRVGVCLLPPWREEELRALLNERLEILMPGEPPSDVRKLDLPPGRITHEGQNQLFDLIARGALQGKNEGRDAPLHVLRLARGIFAAAAGCWEEFSPPLDLDQMTQLITCYWQADRRGG